MFQDTAAASLFLSDHVVHLAFVDISMPKESGLQFAQRMSEIHRNLHIVFVTSHKEYALDYRVKPVTLERIEKSVKKALTIHRVTEADKDDKEMNKLHIYGLGGLEVCSSKGGSVKWISRKSSELFGYLLLNRGRMVSRARITDDIFSGMPQKNAEIYLNTAIYQLRKSLEPLGMKTHVKSDNDGYGLDRADFFIDFVEFEFKLKQLDVIDASNLDRAMEIEELYVGELFGEKSFLWALNDIERLSSMYSNLVRKIVQVLLYNNETAVAVRLLNKLLRYNEISNR